MSIKRRIPREQLIEAGKIARKMLREKGIEAKKSILDEIMKSKGAPILPGLPTYLPHRWTLRASQRMLYDIILIWKEECKKDYKKMENITEFWKFMIKQLRKQEKVYKKELKQMPELISSLKQVPFLKDVFSPLQKYETMKAMQRFFVDSFAVSIALKKNVLTSDYANWFLDWTTDLEKLWLPKKKREKLKK